MRNNISVTTKNNLCTGCGVCEDVCPKHCISIRNESGELRPVLDDTNCLGDKCGRCLKVCPGIGTDLSAMAKQLFDDVKVKEDKYIGRYVGLHTGYSLDDNVRFHSASGGMVSQFLVFLLERKIIDGAVVTGFSDDHVTPVSYIARTRDEVLRAKGSKYCPVALNRIGNEIVKDSGTRFVIVGLPCHIQGFRKRASIDKKFREKVVGYFSLYCSSGRTLNARDYIFKHYGVLKAHIRYFAFRDEGCLGSLTILHDGARGEEFPSLRTQNYGTKCRESESLKKISIPFTSYYGGVLRSFFKPHRCLACIDHYGELADVCFGDIHIPPYSEDKIGISSWITRSGYWEDLFKKAVEDGYVKMDDVSVKTLNDSQADMLYPKRRRAVAVMNMDKCLGRTVPSYDKSLPKPSVKDYVSMSVCHVQRFIGRRRVLWWIIEMLNKRK